MGYLLANDIGYLDDSVSVFAVAAALFLENELDEDFFPFYNDVVNSDASLHNIYKYSIR